jgi:hypothetical protein
MRNALIVSVCLLAALPVFSQVERGGTLPPPLPIFPRSNWWNVDISQAPVDPNSVNFINFIDGDPMHPDFGGDADDPPEIYGIPYVVVPGSTPLEQVFFYESDDESDHGAPGRPPGYPIPVAARTETKWIEGGYAANDPSASGDRHILIVDRDNRILFELYATRYNTTLNRWEAASGAIFPLDSNVRRPETWTSADAAGLAMLPGLVRYDEVFSGDPIKHAFRVTMDLTNGYVFPASHQAGSTGGALPMGARLRMKASTDVSSYPAEVQRVFQAMKTYGLIVADNGSNMYVTGMYDTRWDNGVLNPAFHSLDASDFEVIHLGWQPLRTRSDFNGDVRNDLLLRHIPANSLAMWMLDGTAISAGGLLGSSGSFTATTTADFDGDGNSDVLLVDGAGTVAIWLMNGAAIKAGAILGTPGGYNVAGAGDFDRDGRADILLRDASGNLAVWIMHGTTISAGAVVGAAAGYNVAAVADFSGDGRADILLRNASGTLAMWLMNGAAIGSGAVVATPSGYTVPGAGDFNGDGKADILLRDAGNTLAIWTMNGATITAGAFVGSTGAYAVAGVADHSGDARADLVLRHATTGDVAVWLMNGAVITAGAVVGPLDPAYEIVR